MQYSFSDRNSKAAAASFQRQGGVVKLVGVGEHLLHRWPLEELEESRWAANPPWFRRKNPILYPHCFTLSPATGDSRLADLALEILLQVHLGVLWVLVVLLNQDEIGPNSPLKNLGFALFFDDWRNVMEGRTMLRGRRKPSQQQDLFITADDLPRGRTPLLFQTQSPACRSRLR
jgi:hypothetical protein